MELMQGNLLKESSFDFDLSNEKTLQHIRPIELYARGLGSAVGIDNEFTSETYIGRKMISE